MSKLFRFALVLSVVAALFFPRAALDTPVQGFYQVQRAPAGFAGFCNWIMAHFAQTPKEVSASDTSDNSFDSSSGENSRQAQNALKSLSSLEAFKNRQFLSFLGSGGQGAVFLFHDPQLGKNITVKVEFKNERRYEESNTYWEVFFMNRVGDKVAPKVIDSYVGEPVSYIAMEELKGETLRKWVHEKTLQSQGLTRPDLNDLLKVLIRTADALEAVHKANILHLDIKPDNIFVTTENDVRILDFGLSEWTENPRWKGDASGGTDGYKSPEQEEDTGDVTVKSDVYSFTKTIFNTIYSFDPDPDKGSEVSEDPDAMEDWLVNDAYMLGPRGGKRHIPKALVKLIMAGVAEDPEDRPASMKEVSDKLTKILNAISPEQ